MPWSPEQRNEIVSRISRLSRGLSGRNRAGYTDEQLDTMEVEEEMLLEEYAENLPYHKVSRCPVCGEIFELPIDLGGLDGPWWWESCPVDLPEPVGCEHYQVFLGALNLRGRTPVEVTDGVSPGPGAPYVIDRLIETEGAQAVLSSVTLATGDTGYLIVYFAEEPIDDMDLHQEWRHEFYSILDEDGEPELAESKLDPWDFDLEPWIIEGALHWIEAGDEALVLNNSLPCPYSNIDATRMSQVISAGEVELQAPPSGGESSIYEPA